jgi:hypothetical protein
MNPTFDLTDCATDLELPRQLPQEISGEVTWQIRVDDESYAFIRVRRPNLQFVAVSGIEIHENYISFDDAEHRWWRMRDDSGQLSLETSPDAETWTSHLDHPHSWDLTSVNISLGTIVNTLGGDFEGPQIDNVNRLP